MNIKPKINFGNSPQNTISQPKFQIERRYTVNRDSAISLLEEVMGRSFFSIYHLSRYVIAHLGNVNKCRVGLSQVGGAA